MSFPPRFQRSTDRSSGFPQQNNPTSASLPTSELPNISSSSSSENHLRENLITPHGLLIDSHIERYTHVVLLVGCMTHSALCFTYFLHCLWSTLQLSLLDVCVCWWSGSQLLSLLCGRLREREREREEKRESPAGWLPHQELDTQSPSISFFFSSSSSQPTN